MSQYNVYSSDDFARLIQRKPSEILTLMLEIAENSRQHPDTAYVVPYRSMPLTAPNNVKVEDFGWMFIDEGKCRTVTLPTIEIVEQRLSDLMPFHEELSWDGYVAAGSFAALICQPINDSSSNPEYMVHKPSDVDFYPYCSHGDRGDLSMQEAAMRSYKQFLDDMTEAIEEGDTTPLFNSYITRRNANCTTISVELNPEHNNYNTKLNTMTDYQIIHRAHTSPTSVVVGFDQMACKVFYDGDGIYLTLDAALCLYFGINPVDWRRESPSHLRRTYKYYRYGYTPIFPGLSLNLQQEFFTAQGKSYYLPGCLLQSHNSKIKKGKIVFDNWSLSMVFESYHLTLHKKIEAGIATIDDFERYTREELDKFRENCLNLEEVPQVPFSQEAKESDYSSETTAYMAQCYHVLSLVIREKYNLFSVYTCDGPNQIVDNAQGINVRATLKKVMVGRHSEFYFGTDRVYRLQREMARMVAINHDGRLGVKLLKKDQMQEFIAMQLELNEIFEARAKELEALVEPQVAKLQEEGVKFITCNPGAQFTASFKPIIRSKPQDYWGKLYTPVPRSRLNHLKITLMCIRKFHRAILSLLDKNVMKMICDYIDMLYFRQDKLEQQIVIVPYQLPAVPSAASLLIQPQIATVAQILGPRH